VDYQALALAWVFPQEVSGMIKNQMRNGSQNRSKVKENALTSIEDKTHIF